MSRWSIVACVLTVPALVWLAGCNNTVSRASDPALARETLAGALEAWKRGDTQEAYKQVKPDVTVSDRQWQKGGKLLSFEIDSDGQQDGYDIQFKVKMTVQDAAGKQSKQKAVFNVSTAPALVVVRLESGE